MEVEGWNSLSIYKNLHGLFKKSTSKKIYKNLHGLSISMHQTLDCWGFLDMTGYGDGYSQRVLPIAPGFLDLKKTVTTFTASF